MRMNKIELTNMVEITYCKDTDRNNSCNTLLTAMVHVPEESLPPMSEEEKKHGRLLDVYFKKASEILENEIGPIHIYPIYPIHTFRFMGHMTVVY